MRNLTRVYSTVLALVFAVFLLTSRSFADPIVFTGELSEFQPNIRNGGKTLTIAVHPTDADKIYVTSASGGLFRSTDRGAHWQHVDGLPCFQTVSVAYHPADSDIILVTTLDDFKTVSGGGIWRSADGGRSWVQATMPRELATRRISAYEISIVPGSGEIYVGSQYGILKSTNRGATWTYQDVYGDGAQVKSVAALDSDNILAGNERGLRRYEAASGTWVPPATPILDVRDIHALSRSPVLSTQAFAVYNEEVIDTSHVPPTSYYVPHLNYTEDSGRTWRPITGTPGGSGGAGGTFFAKAVYRGPVTAERARVFLALDLFFSDRYHLSKLRIYCDRSTGRIHSFRGWQTLAVDHEDISDIAFDKAEYPNPILLATDGGLHKTTDRGAHWTLTGGGRNGYNALQVTEVQGQLIENILRYDLYIGTWDNNLWASGDDGVTWPHSWPFEGMFIEAEKIVPTASASKINFVGCGNCVNYISDPLFRNVTEWPNPPGDPGGSPVMIVKRSMRIQKVSTVPGRFSEGIAVTNTLGRVWGQYLLFPYQPLTIPKLGYAEDARHLNTVYLAYRSDGWYGPGNFGINKLVMFWNALNYFPLMNDFGSLGINVRDVAPYAIDPGNFRHIIAPDVINNKMMETTDSGNNWTEIPGLTDLVTDGGRLRFSNGISPLVTALSFSPQMPDIVIAGTAEGGLYLSTDNGRNWTHIYGSERVAYPTGFAWKTAADVIISSWGRGLWRLRGGLSRTMTRSDFRDRCAPSCQISSWEGVSANESAFDRGLLVYEGRIMGARVANGILKEVFVSNGSSVIFATENKQDPGIKVTQTNKYIGFTGVNTAPKAPRQTPLMKGLVFDRENRLKGAVFGDKQVTMYEPKEIKEPPQNQNTKSPMEGKPYVTLTVKDPMGGPGPGEMMLVTSPNLERNTDIVIYVDSEPAAKVRTDGQGNLRTQVHAPVEFTRHSLTIRYARDEKKVIDGTMFSVRHKDDAENEKKEKDRKKQPPRR